MSPEDSHDHDAELVGVSSSRDPRRMRRQEEAEMICRRKVTPRNRAALITCRRILRLVHASRQRSRHRSNRDAAVIDLLLDKAEKTARAALLLATRGYADDRLVLPRSPAGLPTS